MIADDRKRYEQAREAGRAARRAAKPIGSNPYRGHTPPVRDLHNEFDIGWREQDSATRARRG